MSHPSAAGSLPIDQTPAVAAGWRTGDADTAMADASHASAPAIAIPCSRPSPDHSRPTRDDAVNASSTPPADAAAALSYRAARRRHFGDRDVLHSAGIALLACLLSGGLLYLAYFVAALRVALRRAGPPRRAHTLLLFGKRLAAQGIDAEFATRIARLHAVLGADPQRRVLLLGGHSGHGLSEAAAARQELERLGLPDGVRLDLETGSTDTLENLRNARELLGSEAHRPVALISSRHHLLRCLLLARSLGFDAEPCAAEPRLPWQPRYLGRLALEAGYCLWLDIGTRWARLIGHRRMLARVT